MKTRSSQGLDKVFSPFKPALIATVIVFLFPLILKFLGIVGPVDQILGRPEKGATLAPMILYFYIGLSLFCAGLTFKRMWHFTGWHCVIGGFSFLGWFGVQTLLIVGGMIGTFGK